MIVSQILFVILLGVVGFLFYKRFSAIIANIKLGKDEAISDNKGQRFNNMLLIAFGQKKMFKRFLPALLHLFVYIGFLLINIEMLEIFIDGIFGTHRFFLNFMDADLYGHFISIFEFLGLGVTIGCIVFLIRRNVVKVKRFLSKEMSGRPRTDANLILFIEIALMSAILIMNSTDAVLQTQGHEHYSNAGHFLVSSNLNSIFTGMSIGTLVIIERIAWWFHITGVLAFLIYVTYSKHLHIFLAFPNTYFANLGVVGEMRNMPEITAEVKMMLFPESVTGEPAPPPESFGAKDVTDLSWRHLLSAYTCTECGRCTSSCPANITGKKLSPRKIMMDTRSRAEELGKAKKENGADFKDEKSLFDYISAEELRACTTCNACVEECPVNIEPVAIINELKRHLIMDLADAPNEWNGMFTNIENNGAPWQFSPADRFNWAEDLKNEAN